MSNETRVDVDSSPDPVTWLESVGNGDPIPALWGLHYSIYYGSVEDIAALPDRLVKAYGRVQEAIRA